MPAVRDADFAAHLFKQYAKAFCSVVMIVYDQHTGEARRFGYHVRRIRRFRDAVYALPNVPIACVHAAMANPKKTATLCALCVSARDDPQRNPMHLVHPVTSEHMLFDVRSEAK
jgi:hypothetical protein